MSEELTFDSFMARFRPYAEEEVPLDFSYEKEGKCFYITLVVQWRIMDAFILHPRLRSFVRVSVETQNQYDEMLAFLKCGRDHVIEYLDKQLAQCQNEGF